MGKAGRPPLTEDMRLIALQHKNDMELQRAHFEERLIMDLLNSDIETKLLLVALGGTATTAVLAAYQSYTQARKEYETAAVTAVTDEEKKKLTVPNLFGFLTGLTNQVWNNATNTWETVSEEAWKAKGGVFGMLGLALDKHFDKSKLSDLANSNNPYSAGNALLAAATTTTGIAWGLLAVRLAVGQGGIGGLMRGVGGMGADVLKSGGAAVG